MHFRIMCFGEISPFGSVQRSFSDRPNWYERKKKTPVGLSTQSPHPEEIQTTCLWGTFGRVLSPERVITCKPALLRPKHSIQRNSWDLMKNVGFSKKPKLPATQSHDLEVRANESQSCRNRLKWQECSCFVKLVQWPFNQNVAQSCKFHCTL